MYLKIYKKIKGFKKGKNNISYYNRKHEQKSVMMYDTFKYK